jgi:FkbM family methyltransferase
MELIATVARLADLAKEKDVFFCGAGEGGRNLLKTVRDCYPEFKIKGFLDVFRAGVIDGLPIIPIGEYTHCPEENIIVIASQSWEEMAAILREKGIFKLYFMPPFWAHTYMFSKIDRRNAKGQIDAIVNMLSTDTDRMLFRYLLDARTHGLPLAELQQSESTDEVCLRFTGNSTIEDRFPDHTREQYLDFIYTGEIQTAIQAGVYDGRDILNLNQMAKKKVKAYGFEPSGDIYFLPQLRELEQQSVFIHEKTALWHEDTTLNFYPSMAGSFVSNTMIQSREALKIPATSLDVYCSSRRIGKVDFICCDIEGAEINFLRGARNTILRDRPQMAISIYHSKEQFIEVPLFLNGLLSDYTYRLGHYSDSTNETTLYAIPNELHEG